MKSEQPTKQEAWDFVMLHSGVIHRFASHPKFRRPWSDPDDFTADLQADLVGAFHLFDPKRSRPSTWIYTRAMLVRLRHTRSHRRHDHVELNDTILSGVMQAGPERAVTARATLSALLDIATEDEAIAVLSVAEGWDEDEMRERMGVGRATRNYRLRNLRKRAKQAGIMNNHTQEV